MQHQFKQESLKSLVKYNRMLLITCAFLSASTLVLAIKSYNPQERWVLIPTNEPSKQVYIPPSGYSEVYLREWAYYVMKTLMHTSSDSVGRQIEEIKIISANSQQLNSFFKKHADFIRGSNIQSTFYPKSAAFENNAVVISGLFKYWIGTSDKVISQEKSYRLGYKRGPKDILLLKEVKEVINEQK